MPRYRRWFPRRLLEHYGGDRRYWPKLPQYCLLLCRRELQSWLKLRKLGETTVLRLGMMKMILNLQLRTGSSRSSWGMARQSWKLGGQWQGFLC